MDDLFRDRHAKLGLMVLRLFPKVMQMILRYYVTPQWLKQKYSKQHFSFVLTENEVILMDKLPNMDEFTFEIFYKILRSENVLDEPTCKWGKIPQDTDVEISDDIQRLINATHLIRSITSEQVTETKLEKLLEEIRLIVSRIDSFLELDTLESMFNSFIKSNSDDSISILQDLAMVKAIDGRFLKMI
ncbi:unnamed protein product [Mytilus edulis]|uniref:DZIP3-like HEPN domain-containing protein n=1 Tax=Mytilus edulis TaxID=6550 RepID=A0A8S3RSH7_MYTED|nr:unnamed protein product [Mytilus edulis]